ncbi:hypothetical protein KI387_037678, partial [Taxus chinensis]
MGARVLAAQISLQRAQPRHQRVRRRIGFGAWGFRPGLQRASSQQRRGSRREMHYPRIHGRDEGFHRGDRFHGATATPESGTAPRVVQAEQAALHRGVAAGLLYLHEQWEKRVVHRDIKSSNVLLDSEMNGRLGDFGLARLYDHSDNPQTTHVVGTLGYIAPELIHTGKATPSSDVFSFGALLLEVACGRKPVDPAKDAEQVVLLEWVWELYTKQRLLDTADPKLCGDYAAEEMEMVLKLGLLCSHPESERRPTIRLACQVLEGEAPLPDLDIASFDVS